MLHFRIVSGRETNRGPVSRSHEPLSSPPFTPLEYVGFQRIGETMSLVVPADPLCFQTTLWHLESAGEDTFERGEN